MKDPRIAEVFSQSLSVKQIHRKAGEENKADTIKRKNDFWYVKEGLRGRRIYPNPMRFTNTTNEKALKKQAKKDHNKTIREAGFNLLKRMNLSDPQVIRFNN